LNIAIIGGGAAGFFGAIRVAETNPEAEVILYEKTGKLLSKLLISGGGRCNVTHACFDNSLLVQNYPRGQKELRSSFEQFSTNDIVSWFKDKNVKLKTEEDGRMFPVTDSSQTIADCLLSAAKASGVKIKLNQGVQKIIPCNPGFELHFLDGSIKKYDKVLLAAGGGPKLSFFNWLSALDLEIVPPVPSLFTFNIPDKTLHALSGISVDPATISIKETKLQQTGPLLITHWGLSGPAILKLSAFGARILAEKDYNFIAMVCWLPGKKEDSLRAELENIKTANNRKQPGSFSPFGFPSRLWKWMLQKSEIPEEIRWADVSKKQINKLTQNLLQMEFSVNGKSTFKEEFVTAGGVSLKEINLKTMESKKHPGLFFAGELLDIDGITGGFNFQAAWTTGYIAGSNIGK
jgi:predicted Rossmann fold flavoprotein